MFELPRVALKPPLRAREIVRFLAFFAAALAFGAVMAWLEG
jgi:hypothetical protein